MLHALTSPGLPRSPDFLGSLREVDPAFPEVSQGHPFGLRFLTRTLSCAEPLRGLSYDAGRQQARIDTGRPEMKGTAYSTKHLVTTGVDGVILWDVADDVQTD